MIYQNRPGHFPWIQAMLNWQGHIGPQSHRGSSDETGER